MDDERSIIFKVLSIYFLNCQFNQIIMSARTNTGDEKELEDTT